MRTRLFATALVGVIAVLAAAADAAGPVFDVASVRYDGSAANRDSLRPAITSDGRFAAFSSRASNLIDGDSNVCGIDTIIGACSDVFVRDRLLGSTTRASVSSTEAQGNAESLNPDISDDGRFVAFDSLAINFSDVDFSGRDVFVRDVYTGTTELISIKEDGTPGQSGSSGPSISGDGRYVAFLSDGLVPPDTNGATDAYVRDRVLGTTMKLSGASDGSEGHAGTLYVRISKDGRYAVFSTSSRLLPEDQDADEDVYIRDLVDGTLERITQNSSASNSKNPDVNSDGSVVVFESSSSNFGPVDTNGRDDIYAWNRSTSSFTLISIGAVGAQSDSNSSQPAVSDDGLFVSFLSTASNLVAGDSGFQSHVYLRDLAGGTTVKVSQQGSTEGNGFSQLPVMGASGRLVAFQSTATNLGTPNPASGSSIQVWALDSDDDGFAQGRDNCPDVANATQVNTSGNFIDQSPPYMATVDDKTWPNSDAAGDACDPDDDNDGMTDADEGDAGTECAAITDPLFPDSDGDRFLDGVECTLGTDPTVFAIKPAITACGATTDVDGDKLSERIEYCFYGTDPNNSDSDGDKAFDGAKDGCEAASLNGDRIVNVADMGMLAAAIGNVMFRVVSVDVNKDGAWNPADQGLVASFISPAGQCPG